MVLRLIVVGRTADVAVLSGLIGDDNVAALDTIVNVDDVELYRMVDFCHVVIVLPDKAGPELKERAVVAANRVRSLAKECRVVVWSEWPSNRPFQPPTGIETASSLWTWMWSLQELTRPVVVITKQADVVIGQAVGALENDPSIYKRAGDLVRVIRDEIRAGPLRRPPDTPRIATIPSATMLERLTRVAHFVFRKTDRDGKTTDTPALPPPWVVSGVLSRGEWSGIRRLDGIIEAPTLRSDGTILVEAGYDSATALLYVPNASYAEVPDRPTRDDARRAAADLQGLVVDFPFARLYETAGNHDDGLTHRSVWLALILTVLARSAFDGPVPLFAIDATTPGSGKTLLAELVAIIASGRSLPRTPYPSDRAELGKVITAVALSGDRIMLLDNISTPLGGSELDAALTSTDWRGRRLGASEMLTLPLTTVWIATGNNLAFTGDILRRVIHCRLEPAEERPEERDPTKFTIPGPLDQHVLARRANLVSAALTILRAYDVSGRPCQGLPAMDFRAWSDFVRSAVYWATGADPCATRKALTASDGETAARAQLVEGWSELPGANRGIAVVEALEMLRQHPGRYATLRSVLMELSKTNDLPSTRSVGRRLAQLDGRVISGKTIKRVALRSRMVAWRVDSGEFGGFGEFSLNPSREECADNCSGKKHGCTDSDHDTEGRREQTHQTHQTHHAGANGRERFAL